jgi:type IV secretion system protein VirB6
VSGTCQQLAEVASSGVASALRAVDCMAAETISSSFSRLFGAEGALAPVLTILLTLYIAFFAFSLITGRSTLGISALTPRMLTLGLVLTFATSWIAYQNVVWNLAVGGPDWIASILMGTKGSATQIFGDRIDIVFQAIGDVSQNAGAGAAANGAEAAAKGASQTMFSGTSVMWLGALVLLLGTVGILLTARIALAVLLALGPVFVVMALFGGTRGLTAGWLRGVVLTAVTPLFVVLGGGITLELLVPIVARLVQGAQMGVVDDRSAMALFLVAAVHMALMGMVLKVAGTVVTGWQVFGLGSGAGSSGSRGEGSGASAWSAPMAAPAGPMAPMESRTPAVSAASAAVASESPVQGGDGGARSGGRRTVVTQVVGGGVEPMGPNRNSRARGIGSRFRSASNDTGRLPAKEKFR